MCGWLTSAEHWTLFASLYFSCIMSHVELLHNNMNYGTGSIFEVAHAYTMYIIVTVTNTLQIKL